MTWRISFKGLPNSKSTAESQMTDHLVELQETADINGDLSSPLAKPNASDCIEAAIDAVGTLIQSQVLLKSGKPKSSDLYNVTLVGLADDDPKDMLTITIVRVTAEGGDFTP